MKAGRQTAKRLILSKTMSLSLLFVQLANVLTLSLQLSLWLLIIAGFCIAWQFISLVKAVRAPSQTIKFLLIFLGCMLIIIDAKNVGLLLTMVQLLVFSYLLKPFEMRRRRDFYQINILGLLILVCSLIFYQSIAFSVIVLLLVVLNTGVLIGLFVQSKPIKPTVIVSAKLIGQSIPLAIILFVFFPKLPPFWQVPLAKSATTGLSDSVAIGDIANLALSNDLAFRVEFENNPAQYGELYWRTLVLEHFDGSHWRQNVARKSLKARIRSKQLPQISGETQQTLDYQVFIEPTFQHWLSVLDLATTDGSSPNSAIYPLKDFTLYRKDRISQTRSYQVKSYINVPLELSIEQSALTQNLVLPQESNDKLFAYGQSLRQEYQDDKAIIQQVLTQFNQENYRYTLRPPPLINNSLAQFYFETRAGFCEHYASSFTFLMRAAGIPARLVLGYLGGEYNQAGNYYSVYQRDAHAWSEVWLAGQGWVRIDPTAAVHPERVEQGFSPQLFQEQQALNNDLFRFDGITSSQIFQKLRLQMDMLDYQWTKWVIGYSHNKQRSLLTRLFVDQQYLKSALVITVTLVFSFFSLWFFNHKGQVGKRENIWSSHYQQALRYLLKLGINKPKTQSLTEFQQLVGHKSPEVGLIFNDFIKQFSLLQYQHLNVQEQQQAIDKLSQQLKRLKKACRR